MKKLAQKIRCQILRNNHQLKSIQEKISKNKDLNVIKDQKIFCLHLSHSTFLNDLDSQNYIEKIKEKYLLYDVNTLDMPFEHGLIKLLFTTDQNHLYITFRLILTDSYLNQIFYYDDFFKHAFEKVDSIQNEVVLLSKVLQKKLIIHGGSMVIQAISNI